MADSATDGGIAEKYSLLPRLMPHLDRQLIYPLLNFPDDENVEKQKQALRFEDNDGDEQEEHNAGHGAHRPRVNTSMEKARKPRNYTPNTPGKQSVLHGAHVKDLDPAADRLAEDQTPLDKADFYQLMGLDEPAQPRPSAPSSIANLDSAKLPALMQESRLT